MIVNVKHNWELHCHSTFSDGQLDLAELFEHALAHDVEHLALTDHDTASGFRHAVDKKLVPPNLTLYPATELSCVWRGRTIHIVGLGIDAYSDSWQAIESDYVRRREKRFQRIVYLLEKAGFTLDEAQIRLNAAPASPARPDIAHYLVETGQVKSTGHAYKRWLGQGKPGDVKQQWPELAEAVAAIVEHGGMAVIAHPHRYKLTWTKTRELIADFISAGGQAIEIACLGMRPDMRNFLVEQVLSNDLWISGGSDFHHTGSSWLKFGRYPDWPKDGKRVTDWLIDRYSLL